LPPGPGPGPGIGTQRTLTAGLDQLGYRAGDVTTAVISHLHQDHIGGLAELSGADIIVSQAEWDTLSSPLPELRGLMRRHIDLPGLRWRRITPEPSRAAPLVLVHDDRYRGPGRADLPGLGDRLAEFGPGDGGWRSSRRRSG
jgi:glyoxylase-like metal-dependent hydrolase (beta-lactamase superfamily II)